MTDIFALQVDVMNWMSSKHNMGMSLNRQVWEQIKKCSKVSELVDH